jgi:hypothetical protein
MCITGGGIDIPRGRSIRQRYYNIDGIKDSTAISVD